MEGALVLQEPQCRFGILFSSECDIQSGLSQCQAEQFPLAGAIFDQENGVMRHHYKERYQQGLCRVMAGFLCFWKILQKQ